MPSIILSFILTFGGFMYLTNSPWWIALTFTILIHAFAAWMVFGPDTHGDADE